MKFGIAAAIIVAVIASSLYIPSLEQGSSTSNTADNTAEKKVVRIGYFPNVNHAQAVIGLGNGGARLCSISVSVSVFFG